MLVSAGKESLLVAEEEELKHEREDKHWIRK